MGLYNMEYKIEIAELPYNAKYLNEDNIGSNQLSLDVEDGTDITTIQAWVANYVQKNMHDCMYNKSIFFRECLYKFSQIDPSRLNLGQISLQYMNSYCMLKFGPVV